MLEDKAKLLGSLLLFTQVFYKLRTGRDFELSRPLGRESHFITICRALTLVQRGEILRLLIQIPPRYGKTELVINFVTWCMALFHDSNFLYVSYSHSLAKKQTQTIKQIIELPHYRKMFGVEISQDASAKDNFETTSGGSVYAAGAMGTITGRGAGIKNIDRFGGAIIIDDIHKPAESLSDTIRTSTNEWYFNTLLSRLNSPKTPIIYIGQETHEDDLGANLKKDAAWYQVVLPALDNHKNALYPEMHTREHLLDMQEKNPYVFSAQYQQSSQPAGGGIFKEDWFVLLDEEPDIVATFITADTAETEKDYNDATAFSFWGLYQIKVRETFTGTWGLHWIDCVELHVEPKDLENEFLDFYAVCMRHRVKPQIAIIEKKSTGVTLCSVLQKLQGLRVIGIERTRASGNKTARFLEAQPYVASKRISLSRNARHTSMCIKHMGKITANDTHRFDDIADTHYDAVKAALIDKIVPHGTEQKTQRDHIIRNIAQQSLRTERLRRRVYG